MATEIVDYAPTHAEAFTLVAKAQAMGATKLYLLTNWACAAAIGLYLRHGFVHDAQVLEFYGPKYARAEVGMSYPLQR